MVLQFLAAMVMLLAYPVSTMPLAFQPPAAAIPVGLRRCMLGLDVSVSGTIAGKL